MVSAGCGTQHVPGTGPDEAVGVQQTDKNITIGYIDWDEDVATTYLWAQLLKQKGYHVTLKSVALGPMFVGLSQGGVDVFFDSWLPEQTPYIKKYQDNVATLGKWYKGQTTEGLVVPTYMKNVNSIADLKKLPSQENQIVGIDPGSVEMDLVKKAISEYGLDTTLVSSSSPAMLSALKKAYDAKQDIAVVLWSPHWAFATYKLKYLADPKGVFGKGGTIQAEANKDWMSSHAQAVDWLKHFTLTQNQLGQLENDINASTKEAGVKKWIQDNQALVNSWLKS
jgi:glycine betaine/proline transport system substrate-binding protein